MAPRKILFICSSDYGQANVILATAYAILATGAPVELHIASEHPMKPEVEQAERLADATLKTAAPYKVHFHGIDGVSHFQAMSRPSTGIIDTWNLHLPSLANSAAFIQRFSYGSMPWEPQEVVDMYLQNVKILKEVNPDLTVVDPLYLPGLTAVHQLKANWTVLAPNTIKDFAVPCQPRAAALWKYPLVGSALPFPIPWSQIHINIALTLLLAKVMLTDPRIKEARRLLREASGDENIALMSLAEIGVVHAPPPGLRVMVAFSEDLDYPIDVMPSHITPCGPIVRHAQELAVVDPALDQWLAKGPTVYINLGTQLRATAHDALEMAGAIRDLFDAMGPNTKLQVLWKLKRKDVEAGHGSSKKGELSWDGEWKAVQDMLRPEIEADRVKITSWIEADPCSVLLSGHIICSVHHGGANSHHEALAAGVPQCVLPGWIDCYDFGNRVELNGVGIRANKMAAPRWSRNELGIALKELLVGEKASRYKQKAKELAERHPEHAGRNKAASVILEILNAS